MTGHLKRLIQIPEVEVVGVTDPSAANISKMKERVPDATGLTTHASLKDLIEKGGLDAIVISSPHTMHYEQIDMCRLAPAPLLYFDALGPCKR